MTVSTPMAGAVRSMGHILCALLLRNIRTRFFGTGLGFLLAMCWPLVHIGILLGITVVLGRLAPYGESAVLFFATGLAPYIVYLYISRYMMGSVQSARPLISFPIVKITDLLLAGMVLEILSSAASLIVLATVLTAAGENIVPQLVPRAAFAMMAATLLGVSFGVFNSVVVMMLPGWGIVSGLLNIFFYATSGVFFDPSALPERIRYWLWFNPLTHLIEWLRSAYFDGYGFDMLDRRYPIAFSIVLLFAGLLMERVFRGMLLKK